MKVLFSILLKKHKFCKWNWHFSMYVTVIEITQLKKSAFCLPAEGFAQYRDS